MLNDVGKLSVVRTRIGILLATCSCLLLLSTVDHVELLQVLYDNRQARIL